MWWNPKVYGPHRGLRALQADLSRIPSPKPPTEAETRRLEPLMPLYAQGVLPLDPEGKERVRRFMEGKYREMRYHPRRDDGEED